MIAYNDDGNLVELGGKTTSLFGTCSTAADIAAKTVTLPNLDSLRTGVSVVIKFTNSNTASNPTLQINSTGAKPIYRYGSNKAGINPYDSWVAGSIQTFTYDGTNWVLNEQQDLSYLMPIEITKDAYDQLTQDELLDRTFFIIDYESVVDVPASSVEYDNTSSGMSATNVQTAIDELKASSAVSTLAFGVCSTGESTAAKTVSLSSVTSLNSGLSIVVKFANSNTAANPTLQVNSLDAKPIYKFGSTAPGDKSFTSWEAGSIVSLTYDGTAWVMNDQIDSTYFRPIEITKENYDLLTPAEIQDKVFFITDYNVNEGIYASQVEYINAGSSLSATSVQSAISELALGLSDKVDKVSGKGLSTKDFTAAYESKLNGIAAGAEVNVQSNWAETSSSSDAFIKNKPTKVSDFTNDSGFITNTVDNLTNYYAKSTVYTKAEVDNLISAAENGRFEVVDALPTTGIKTNVIYLVPKSESQTDNVKDEYINIGGSTAGWEKIGDTEIDLSNYVQGSGSQDCLVKFSGSSSVTSGPAIGSSTTTFLRNDGTWNEPVDTRFVTLSKVQYDALGTAVLTDNKYYFITDWTPASTVSE